MPLGSLRLFGALAPTVGRSSDLQALPWKAFLLTVASRLIQPVLARTAFVPAYRCGAALDSHQVPFSLHKRGDQQKYTIYSGHSSEVNQ